MRTHLTRRSVLTGLTLSMLATAVRAAPVLDGAAFGLDPAASGDQSQRLQTALDAAAAQGLPLHLPAGRYSVADVRLPDGLHLAGIPGHTILTTPGDRRLAALSGATGVLIEGIGFEAAAPETAAGVNGLVEVDGSTGVTFRQCTFRNAAGNGLMASDAAVTVEDCDFDGASAAAIHSQNGRGLLIRGNRIVAAANAGIRVWRDSPGADGTIITGNRISGIDWTDGGNGQNGNGVSVYNADEVIVADNHIANCAFTAVRINTGRNCQVRGNTCLNSGEVAIFSEFGFSGSVIANNVVDGAATGISITNLDSGGHLATCSGNIVRNIAPQSKVNPDTRPVGIFAEADAVIANNSVENVPGVGIAVGYGSFVRNVVVANNGLVGTTIGIGVSVVQEQSPGPVRVDGNIIGAGTEHAIVGLEWEKIVSDDLARDAGRYPNVSVDGNVVG